MAISKRKTGRVSASEAVTYETVREIARRLPGTVEGTSYGTPAFRVGKNLFVRLKEDGESLVVKIDFDQRVMRMNADPEAFYITDHYLNYPWVLVRLRSVAPDDLRDLIQDAWRLCAPKRLLCAEDNGPKGTSGGASRKRHRE